ncbi:MAG TPA: hypothetical protein VFZ34_23780 [Blastocatellia bacterium]|nr:hypothetical protein [Blastocatellia bacterium]
MTCALNNPAGCLSYGKWLATFPLKAEPHSDKILNEDAPASLRKLVTTPINSAGLLPDCADVAFILRHSYLKARGKSFSFKVGPKISTAVTCKLGAGVTDAQLRKVMINAGTMSFQEERTAFALINFYRGQHERIINLKQLLSAGLKPGDVFVWKRRPEIVSSNFQGHSQTVQTIIPPVFDEQGDVITQGMIVLLQGNMSAGKGKGELQQRVYTFSELTGREDGDDRIVFEPRFSEEFFFGAGPWKG